MTEEIIHHIAAGIRVSVRGEDFLINQGKLMKEKLD